MEIKKFERMLSDALVDVQHGVFPSELQKNLHYVNTFERLETPTLTGVRIILNNGSKFDLIIK